MIIHIKIMSIDNKNGFVGGGSYRPTYADNTRSGLGTGGAADPFTGYLQ